jgi:hypothetical protein
MITVFTILGEKIAFILKNKAMIQFLQKTSSTFVGTKKAIFAKMFGDNVLKIITTLPDLCFL